MLEVGTGSGFQAAVLARLGKEVYTIERIDILAKRARQVLGRLGYANVRVFAGDGTLGLPKEAPFDAIMVTAGTPTLPKPLIEQMKEGGRMVKGARCRGFCRWSGFYRPAMLPEGNTYCAHRAGEVNIPGSLITKEGGKLHFAEMAALKAHFENRPLRYEEEASSPGKNAVPAAGIERRG